MSDFVAGAVSGFAQTLVGHPFDTAKVLIQNGKSFRGMPFQHYFRGIVYPLMSNSFLNGVLFKAYNTSYQYTDNRYISGAIAGMIGSPIVFLFDCAKTVRQVGEKLSWHRILYTKGYPITLAREMTALSSYFYTFYTLKERNIDVLTAGGIAGLVNWTVSYPLDVLRNRQIGMNISLREAYAMRNFWKGYSICAVRAVIVNSVGFWVYEKALNTV